MPNAPTLRVGRYQLFHVLASGGMASVYAGRIVGTAGFSRTVAIKRLHPHLASDPDFVNAFADEARIASRVSHPNVVSTLDVVSTNGELFVVMDYVHGASLSELQKRARAAGARPPLRVVAAVIVDMLYGLHAAHEATGERGRALDIIHRDVSPHNVLVGADGVTRVADFGVAKASSRLQSTREGVLKGKLPYMSPEQINRNDVDRRADVYAAGVVLWEALTQRSLFGAPDAPAVIAAVLEGNIPPASSLNPDVPPELDRIIAKAASPLPEDRFATALDFARAILAVVTPAAPHEVGEWVDDLAHDALVRAQDALEHMEIETGGAATSVALPAAAATTTPPERAAAAATDTPASALGATPTARASTQPSSIPVAAGRAHTWRWVAAAAFVAGVTIAAWRGRALMSAATAYEPDTSPSAVIASTTAAGSTAPTAPPAATAGPAMESSSAGAASSPATSVGHDTAPPASSGTSRARPGKKRGPCATPYVVDKDGVKRFKPECL